MYKKMDKQQRATELAALAKQLDVLEEAIAGPFMAGSSMSSADGALFPTFVFLTYMLPAYFGWANVFAGRPKLAAWWAAVNKDPVAARVGGLGADVGMHVAGVHVQGQGQAQVTGAGAGFYELHIMSTDRWQG
jgi:glutathione S-transferase